MTARLTIDSLISGFLLDVAIVVVVGGGGGGCGSCGEECEHIWNEFDLSDTDQHGYAP